MCITSEKTNARVATLWFTRMSYST